jgi:hypothetical protein
MALSHEHVQSKIPAKIKISIKHPIYRLRLPLNSKIIMDLNQQPQRKKPLPLSAKYALKFTKLL